MMHSTISIFPVDNIPLFYTIKYSKQQILISYFFLDIS